MMVSSSVGSAGAASQAAGLAKMRQSMRAPGSSGENSAARPGDSVELSANAKAQATANATVNATANATANAVAKSTAQADTDIRHDKVTQMQVKIASGKYDKLSEAMLDKVATGLLRDLGLQG